MTEMIRYRAAGSMRPCGRVSQREIWYLEGLDGRVWYRRPGMYEWRHSQDYQYPCEMNTLPIVDRVGDVIDPDYLMDVGL